MNRLFCSRPRLVLSLFIWLATDKTHTGIILTLPLRSPFILSTRELGSSPSLFRVGTCNLIRTSRPIVTYARLPVIYSYRPIHVSVHRMLGISRSLKNNAHGLNYDIIRTLHSSFNNVKIINCLIIFLCCLQPVPDSKQSRSTHQGRDSTVLSLPGLFEYKISFC